jgi:hypothetical protein
VPEPPSPPDPVAEAPRPPTPPDPAPQAATREPTPDPAPGESPAPSPVPVPGPIAMLEPTYRRPSEALDRRRMVVAMRGPDAGKPVLAALAPEHVAFTADSAPALFWSLSGPLPEGSKLLFRILEERSGEALVERELAAPTSPGLQRILLAEQGATLAPGVVYTWFVVLRADPENPARDELAQGWIERREMGGVTGAEPGALPAQLAQGGLWYDALAAALELRAREPGNDSVARGIRALLTQGGVSVELDR